MTYPAWLTNAARKILLPELTELHELADERWKELQKVKLENTNYCKFVDKLWSTKDKLEKKEAELTALTRSYSIQGTNLAKLNTMHIEVQREAELLLEERTDHILQIRNLKQELKDAQDQLDRTLPMATPAAKPRKPRKAKVNSETN